MDRPPIDSDVLNGWKEIAAWLGRTPRSAQRWERELGLPVHRFKTAEGQAVYARRSELDAWRATRRLSSGGPSDELERSPNLEVVEPVAGETDQSHAAPVTASPQDRRWASTAWRTASVVLVALGIGLGVMTFGGIGIAEPDARTYELTSRSFRALNEDGRTAWEHAFGVEVFPALRDPKPISVDLDRDGREELLVAVASDLRRLMGGQQAANGLYCFRDTGELCWVHQPDRVFTCGGGNTYAPP